MPGIVDRYLLPREVVEFEVRRHWFAIVDHALTYAAFLIGGFLVLGLAGDNEPVRLFASSFILLSTAWFAWYGIEWQIERLVVTKKRVLLISGIATRKVAIMPLAKVTDLTYSQSLTGRLLHYGTFVVESAGQAQALSKIEYIPEPDRHYQQVSQLLFGDDSPVDPDDGLPPPPGPDLPPPVPPAPQPPEPPPPPPPPGEPPVVPPNYGEMFPDDDARHHTAPLPRI